MTATEFGLRRQLRTDTTYIRTNGEGFRLYKGKLITEADFSKATELPQRPYICASNPCRKHQYLNVEGSVLDNLEKLIK